MAQKAPSGIVWMAADSILGLFYQRDCVWFNFSQAFPCTVSQIILSTYKRLFLCSETPSCQNTAGSPNIWLIAALELWFLRNVLHVLMQKETSFVSGRRCWWCLLPEGLSGLSWLLQAQEGLEFPDSSLAAIIHLHNLYNGRRNSVS